MQAGEEINVVYPKMQRNKSGICSYAADFVCTSHPTSWRILVFVGTVC